jgi:hypothetical protein
MSKSLYEEMNEARKAMIAFIDAIGESLYLDKILEWLNEKAKHFMK